MEILKRKFEFKSNGVDYLIDDPNPKRSNKEILRSLSSLYPDITNSNITEKIENDVIIVTFESILGTKG